MSITLFDSDQHQRFDDRPPLENVIHAKPRTLHVYSELLAANFGDCEVFYPIGIEDATNRLSIETTGFHRPTAPMALSQDSKMPQLSSQSGIRPVFTAYLAATFISFLDARTTPKQYLPSHAPTGGGALPNDALARSLIEELTHAAKNNANAQHALGRGGAPVYGPHSSQRSRRMAATLLLPRCTSGRTRANSCDVVFLDVLALIAASTNKPNVTIDADGHPRVPSSAGTVHLTDNVRLSVVAGSTSVANFAKTIGINDQHLFLADKWKKNAILCFSYVLGNEIKHIPCVLEDAVAGAATTSQALSTLQNAALYAQLESSGQLILPHAFVSPDYVAFDDYTENEPHFLRILAEKQVEFRKLYLHETVVETPPGVVERYDIDAMQTQGPRSVRVCSRSREFSETDETHCPGMLFTTNNDLLGEYLLRCRLLQATRNADGRWDAYGLWPPSDEERQAEIGVLWMRLEAVHVGARLNLFFPRVLMGREVTSFQDSRVLAVVPTLSPIEKLLVTNNFVLPVSAESMVPMPSPISNSLFAAYGKAMDTSFYYIKALKEKSAPPDGLLQLEDAPSRALRRAVSEDVPESPKKDDLFFSALVGAKIGHPASTCGEAYDLLEAHDVAGEHLCSRAFNALLATGISKLGADVSVHDLLGEATAALVEKLSLKTSTEDDDDEPASKRSRTPNGTSRSPPYSGTPPPLTSALRQDSLASGLSDATVAPLAPVPLTRQDSLRTVWIDDQNVRRIIGLAGLSPFTFPDVDGGSPSISTALTPDDFEDLVDAIWKVYGVEQALFDEMTADDAWIADTVTLPPPPSPSTPPSARAFATFEFVFAEYVRLIATKRRSIGDEFDTFVVFRSMAGGDATVIKKAGKEGMEPTTTAAFLETTEKKRMLFLMTMKQQPGGQLPGPVKFALHAWVRHNGLP